MHTIEKKIESTYIIEKSKFIAKLYPLEEEKDILSFIENAKKQYPDATHICYAYRYQNIQKAFDDGEPSGTAGMPILNILEKQDLDHILCIVIRYFGGIKLGAGGLIRAYSNCSKCATEKANIIDMQKGFLYNICFAYENVKQMDYICKTYQICKKEFGEQISYQIKIPAAKENLWLQEIKPFIISIFKQKELYIQKSP